MFVFIVVLKLLLQLVIFIYLYKWNTPVFHCAFKTHFFYASEVMHLFTFISHLYQYCKKNVQMFSLISIEI